MATIIRSDILDDLRVADQALRKFEQRYWLSSDVFYELYSQGLLDDGLHPEDFAEWAGHCELKLKRETALEQFSTPSHDLCAGAYIPSPFPRTT